MSEDSVDARWSPSSTYGQQHPFVLSVSGGHTVMVRNRADGQTGLVVIVNGVGVEVPLRPLECAVLAQALEERS